MGRAAPFAVLAVLAACEGTASSADPPRPPPPGLSLSVAANHFSGDPLSLSVSGHGLAPGEVVEFGIGTREGDGHCPFADSTGGSPCLGIRGRVRSFGTAEAADVGGVVRADLTVPVTTGLRRAWLQAFLYRGTDSAVSEVEELTLHQPWPDLDPRVEALELLLVTLRGEIEDARDQVDEVLEDYATSADLAAYAAPEDLTAAIAELGTADAYLGARLDALETLLVGEYAHLPATSCRTLHDARPTLPSGVYWIDPNGGDVDDAFEAACEMVADGGGWTRVVNIRNSSIAHGHTAGAYGDVTVDTEAAKLSDATIQALSTVGYWRYQCGAYHAWVRNAANVWVSATTNGQDWSIDRGKDGVFECGANRAGYVFSEYPTCPAGHTDYAAVTAGEGQGCYVDVAGWNLNGALWAK